jgi:hypothetical protein
MIIAAGASACTASIAEQTSSGIPREARALGYTQLIFEDEFEGPDGPNGVPSGWSNQLWYAKPIAPEMIERREHYRRFIAAKGRSRGNGISTFTGDAQTRTFRFGYFEARMRWPAERDNWSAFWLMSAAAARAPYKGPWPPYCEIDVVEGLPAPNAYLSTVHNWQARSKQDGFAKQNAYFGRADVATWNRYGVLWQPGRISFFLNGRLTKTIRSPAICDSDALFIVVGAQRHGPETRYADVDWVRVYR